MLSASTLPISGIVLSKSWAQERVVTDGHTSYPRAIVEELGTEVEHEVRSCLGNPIEQSHRGIKQRYYPTLGFGAVESVQQFCQAFDEVKQLLRPRARMAEFVSLSERRERFLIRVDELQKMFASYLTKERRKKSFADKKAGI